MPRRHLAIPTEPGTGGGGILPGQQPPPQGGQPPPPILPPPQSAPPKGGTSTNIPTTTETAAQQAAREVIEDLVSPILNALPSSEQIALAVAEPNRIQAQEIIRGNERTADLLTLMLNELRRQGTSRDVGTHVRDALLSVGFGGG
jgi:hypothetical protein